MTPVSQFAQYLLKQDPQRHPGRQTLFNFIKCFLEPDIPFSPLVIHAFYSRILQFEHWQQESDQLAAVVRTDVEGFLSHHSGEQDLTPWKALRHSDTLQIVPVKIFQDLEELVRAEHAPRQKSGDQLKTVKISDQQILALVLAPTGNLEAKVYPNLAMVSGARLRLVAPVTHLYYASDLELMPHVKQVLEGSLITTHAFHADKEGLHGLITRGHTLQKFETYIRAKLSETQDLLHSLKKVERHFVNPQTDPFYQDLVARLERANRLLNHPTPANLMEAERTLNRGRLSLKNIFPNDRLLTLLVTHLDYGITQRRDQGHQEPQTQTTYPYHPRTYSAQ